MAKKYGKRYTDPREALAARTERNENGCLIWTGATTGKSGYGAMKFRGKIRTVHSVAYELEHGPIPAGIQIDHRDMCDRLCAEVAHLREATHAQNQWNKGPQVNNTSGHKNVFRSRSGWVAAVGVNGKQLRKQFRTEQEAIAQAEAWTAEHHGEFARRG